jgi:hypothetical protein
VGGAIASTLAIRARVTAIRLIDRAADLAAGKALDIQQAGPVEGFDTRLTASSDPRPSSARWPRTDRSSSAPSPNGACRACASSGPRCSADRGVSSPAS